MQDLHRRLEFQAPAVAAGKPVLFIEILIVVPDPVKVRHAYTP